MNDKQTPATEETLSRYPEEVREKLAELLGTVPFIRNLISAGRRRAKDMPHDGKGRVIVDFANPHILEDMDYFRPKSTDATRGSRSTATLTASTVGGSTKSCADAGTGTSGRATASGLPAICTGTSTTAR